MWTLQRGQWRSQDLDAGLGALLGEGYGDVPSSPEKEFGDLSPKTSDISVRKLSVLVHFGTILRLSS